MTANFNGAQCESFDISGNFIAMKMGGRDNYIENIWLWMPGRKRLSLWPGFAWWLKNVMQGLN